MTDGWWVRLANVALSSQGLCGVSQRQGAEGLVGGSLAQLPFEQLLVLWAVRAVTRDLTRIVGGPGPMVLSRRLEVVFEKQIWGGKICVGGGV